MFYSKVVMITLVIVTTAGCGGNATSPGDAGRKPEPWEALCSKWSYGKFPTPNGSEWYSYCVEWK